MSWMEPRTALSLSASSPSLGPGDQSLSPPILASNLMPRSMEPITKFAIDDAIDKAVQSDRTLVKELESYGLKLSRARDADDWDKISGCEGIQQDASLPPVHDMTPWFFGIQILNAEKGPEDEGKLCGVLTFNVAFSSWNGRILYLDRLSCPSLNENVEKLFLRILASVASDLQFARLTWRHSETPQWHTEERNRPEMHGEVLTLSMDKEALNSYVETSVGGPSLTMVHQGTFRHPTVESSIQSVLVKANIRSSESSKYRLRLAQQSDIGTIRRLIQALADYVNEPDAVEMTPENYKQDGFSTDPLFYSLLVDHVGDDGSTYPCGYAICFFGYELGKGRFLYLEDLFLEVDYRQGGGGSLVMSTLAQICQSLQCSQLYWQALDWNTAGLKFYEKIGATILEGVKTSRYCGDAMTDFAEDSSG